MKKNLKQDILSQAYKLGTQAFNSKKQNIPVKDNSLMNYISSIRHLIGYRVGSSAFIMKEWAKGWNDSNLNAPYLLSK